MNRDFLPSLLRRFSTALKRVPHAASAAVVAAGVVALLIIRIHLFGSGAQGSIVIATIHSDAVPFGLALLLYGLSLAAERAGSARAPVFSGLIARLIRGAAVVVVVIYAADIFAYRYFHTRLYFLDVMEFSKEVSAAYSMAKTGYWMILRRPRSELIPMGALLTLWGVAIAFFLIRSARASWRTVAVATGAGALLLLVANVPLPANWFSIGDKLLFENVFKRNLVYSSGKPYSQQFQRDLLARYKPEVFCEDGLGQRPDIVLLVVEGLSEYQSRFFSGLDDFTPHLDSLAERHEAFTQMYANGWTTRGGLIALLTGRVPIVGADVSKNPWGSPTLEEFYLPDNVPSTLKKVGYRTAFLTTGDLSFTNKRAWLENLGFDVTEGSEATFYEPFPRGSFDAAPDSALFERALSFLASWKGAGPRFLVLETVSSHQPFHAIDGTQDTEENVLRYVDRQIGWFVPQLLEENVLHDPLVIVIGDHRAMTPFSRRELKRFGLSASALVPMIVARTDGTPAVHDEPSQQTDLMASLSRLVQDRACRGKEEGWFLGGPVDTAHFIVHARGDDRDLLYVRAQGTEGLVRIDGDDTHVERGDFPDPRAVLDAVNYLRMTRKLPGRSGPGD